MMGLLIAALALQAGMEISGPSAVAESHIAPREGETEAELIARAEARLLESGMSPAAIALLNRTPETEAKLRASLDGLMTSLARWEAALASPAPEGTEVIEAARQVRSGIRAFLDLRAEEEEKIIEQLSPHDLRLFLNRMPKRNDHLLGMLGS